MTVLSKVGNFIVNSTDPSSTTYEITVGFQPKVILFWWGGNASATDAVTAQSTRYGFGSASSTTSRACVGGFSTHASSNINGARIARWDAAVATVLNTGTVDGLLDVQSIGSSSFTMIIDDVFASSVRVSYLALGGDEITNVFIGDITANTTTGIQSITGVGFQPDFLLTFGTASTTAPPLASTSRDFLSVGAAASPAEQAILSVGEGPENNATSQAKSYLYTGELIAPLFDTPTEMRNRARLDAFTSDGFDLEWLEAQYAYRIIYVAIAGGNWTVGNLLTQTDTTTDIVETSFGFQPVATFLASHNMAQSTQDTVQNGARATLGAFTSTSERTAQSFFLQDGLANTDASNAIEHDAVYINISSSDTIQGLMDVQSVDSDGFTLIMDDADPAQSFVWYFSVGSSASGDQTLTISDSGSGADAVGGVAVGLALSDSGAGVETFGAAVTATMIDSGAGVDALTQLLASLSLADSGTGADSAPQNLSVAAPVVDGGSGSDALVQLLAQLSLGDSGSGADALPSVAALATLADSGHGTDVISQVAALLSLLDSGGGSDLLSINATVSISDSGSGADALSLLREALKSIADSGAGTDAIGSVAVALIVPDSGGGSDSLSVVASAAVADVGSLTDAISLLIAVVKSVADSGAGIDAVSPAVALSVVDTVSGSDVAGVVVSLAVTDAGSGVDAAALVGALLAIADSGIGSDSVGAPTVNVAISDSGVSVEVAGVTVSLSVPDSGSAIESVSLITETLKSVLDSAVGADGLNVAITLNLSDSGSVADALSVNVGTVISDSGSGNESLSSLTALTVADVGSGIDALLVAVLATINDFAVGADSAGNITVNVPVADLATGADVIGQVAAVLAVADSVSGVDVVVQLDTSKRIVSIVFALTQRTVFSFALAQRTVTFALSAAQRMLTFVSAVRSVSYSFLPRSVEFALGG